MRVKLWEAYQNIETLNERPDLFLPCFSRIFSTVNVNNIRPPDISDLLDWIPPENIKQEYPYYLSGYDYNNLPGT
ncbi:unnamed protein product [Allacma fusca]|uniref:Uncharacterized protein n=1 Tax=Allacma fusca TaxID=39272 RepID=A0A8J2KWV3_9HEXA|nr:unnamed protein product [Allacma fusca]